ncbi:MAG: sodium-dependent transporter [Halobacteriaceae archaeon]
MSGRETWATRIGFIFAAVGSAVGLGNIWRFPYVTAENGGAAFLVVYLVAVLLVGFPAMLAEFSIGRHGQRNIVDVFERVGFPAWRFIGFLGLLTGFWILSYYSVIGGWVLRYVLGSATGAYFGDPSAYFGAVSVGVPSVAFHLVFMALTVAIVAFGVEQGIEWSTKVMVPSIVVLMVALAAWAATLPGSGGGYGFYLTPNVDAIVGNLGTVLPAAVGQALFSLSLGMGVMVTYSSYIASEDNLGVDGISIVGLNTLVGVLAGFVVFPLLAAQGVPFGDPGPGAIFVSMATAFQELGTAGRVLGVVFFLVVALAALSSAISLLEVVVSYFVDNSAFSRPRITVAIGAGTFLLGLPSAWQTSTLGLFDQIASNVLLPLGVFFAVIFVGWIYADDAVAELRRGTRGGGGIVPAWLWVLRVVVFLGISMTLVLSVASLVGISLV